MEVRASCGSRKYYIISIHLQKSTLYSRERALPHCHKGIPLFNYNAWTPFLQPSQTFVRFSINSRPGREAVRGSCNLQRNAPYPFYDGNAVFRIRFSENLRAHPKIAYLGIAPKIRQGGSKWFS